MTRVRQYALIPSLFLLGAIVGVLTPALALAKSDDGHERNRMPAPEMHITGSGSAVVNGATVSGLSGSNITATMLFGSTTVTWTVKTSSSTQFSGTVGKGHVFSDIKVGDVIRFRGPIDSGSLFTVNARVVNDWSFVKKNTQLKGTVASIATSTQSFALNTEKNGVISISLASTSALTLNGTALLFSNLRVGDNVKASGEYDSVAKTLVATRVEVSRNSSDAKFKGFFRLIDDRFHFTSSSKGKGGGKNEGRGGDDD